MMHPRYLPLLAALLVACSPNSDPPPESTTAESTAAESTPAEPSLRLYAFDCGRIHYNSLEPYGIADDATDIRELIVPCFVVEHAERRLLWEGGLLSSFADTEGWHEMEGGWRLRLDRTFQEQIADLPFTLSDFDFVAFSHFHFDHVGIANEVEGATLLIQKPEFEAAFADPITTPGFDPTTYHRLRDGDKLVLEGDHDVFGDGRVRLLSTPGHTPGHQSLFLDLEETGPVVLSGDLHVFHVLRETGRVFPFDMDPDRSRESMARIDALLEETGAELWIGHDLERFESLPQPPDSLQ